MAFGNKKEEIAAVDGSAWILNNAFAEFVLMHTSEIVSSPAFDLRSLLSFGHILTFLLFAQSE